MNAHASLIFSGFSFSGWAACVKSVCQGYKKLFPAGHTPRLFYYSL